MQFFFRFWYVESFPKAWAYYLKTIGSFESQIAVESTWHNMGKPLFQDYTFQGKIIGFFFRIFRILLGLILYFFIACLALIAYILWIILPILCVMSLIGFFVGPAAVSSISTAAQSGAIQ